MKRIFRKLMLLTIALSISAGIYTGSWTYPIAALSLAVFGLLASVGHGSNSRKTNDSAIYGSSVASSSSSSCSDSGGSSGGGDC